MHFKAPDIGLDLGTCNTVVYVKNEGIVISEPTLVISRRGDKKPIAVGEMHSVCMGAPATRKSPFTPSATA